MKLDVVTPEGAKVKDLDVASVTLPGVLGEMGVLPGHDALMTGLAIGPLVVETPAGERRTFAIANGFVEVLQDRVRILAEACERADEIDVDRAKAKLEESERRILEVPPIEGEAHNVLRASVLKARTRIQVGGGH